MEIKRPFSWTSCPPGPSEVEGDGGPGAGGPWGCPAASLAGSLEIQPWFPSPSPLSPSPEEALLGGLWRC